MIVSEKAGILLRLKGRPYASRMLALILHTLPSIYLLPHAQIPFTFFLLLFIHSSIIVLYAVPLDASNTHRTPTQLANDIFGINVTETQDLVNARSQMLSCSRGKLSYIPACATPEQSCSYNVNQNMVSKRRLAGADPLQRHGYCVGHGQELGGSRSSE